MGRGYLRENSVQRDRLHSLVATITDQQLERCLPNGWPVYCVLAHLGFWDQRSTILLRRWAKEGIKPSPADPTALNDALLPFFEAIPARLAADLAIASADIVDTELERASDEFIAGIAALGDGFNLDRAQHRKHHLDKIQAAIA